jgi:hypothetical protein
MDRRAVVKSLAAAGALAATDRLAAPAIAQGAKVLKFVPHDGVSDGLLLWFWGPKKV